MKIGMLPIGALKKEEKKEKEKDNQYKLKRPKRNLSKGELIREMQKTLTLYLLWIHTF